MEERKFGPLADFIKEVREANSIGQKELADRMEISQSTIAKYEAGNTEPGLLFIRRFKEQFGYDLVDEATMKIKPEKAEEVKRGIYQIPEPVALHLKKQFEEFKISFDSTFQSLDAEAKSDNPGGAFAHLLKGKKKKGKQ
jgi:transcriptional regulator with XRE-family HTH domain